ncbi:MAG TPA: error-prone DNA polymerase [Thermodesulfobacteriota bacterium]
MATYAELHCRTYFTFLDGASSPEELIDRAVALGLPALAITDVNGLYGVVEAREALLDRFGLVGRQEERRAPLKLIYGSELHLTDGEIPATDGSAGAPPSGRGPLRGPRSRKPASGATTRTADALPEPDDVVVALATTRDGYGRLSSLISKGRLAVPKGLCRISTDDLCEAASGGGMVLLAGGPRSRAMRLVRQRDLEGAARSLARLREAAGDRLHVELVRHGAPGDLPRSRAMAALAKAMGIPLVATNDVHFHDRARKPLHDVLRCIRDGVTLETAGLRLLPNGEAHLKSPRAMAARFADLPEAVARAGELAAGIGFRLCEVTYHYPVRDVPPGTTPDAFLARIAREGLEARLGAKAAAYGARLEKELALIADLGYAGYFLTMWDVVQECRRQGILCQGRGSAANSLVCFALGITSVHPDEIDMLFERFVSKERHEPPDIDLDIEHEERERILQYVYEKYGRQHAAMVAEVIRYRSRSAVREVGKAMGLSEIQVGRLTTFLSHRWDDLDDRALAAAGFDPKSPRLARLFEFASALEGFPRHLSIHTGGFVLSDRPLAETVPIENGRMENRTIIQWDKNDVDAMGMFKVDLLGLGMLSMIARAFDLLAAHRGIHMDLASVPQDDRATYEMLAEADSVGVFQVESRAQMNMLPRLRPREFYDLVVQVAIVRPGPIHGQMVHPYLRRRQGLEPITYPHPALERILRRTCGVPLFQEQVMRIAEAVGGYTPGEADQLRRDMAAWRRSGRMSRHEAKLREGMLANGIAPEFAERIIEQIRGFGEYGFPESHAAAFARLAYVSAYLKRHYPLEFTCALLNAQPMGFYSVSVIVNDAVRHGVRVLPPDVQASEWDSTLEEVAAPGSTRAGDGLGGAPGSTRAGDGDGPPGRAEENGPGRKHLALRLGLRTIRGLGEEAGKAIAAARRFGGPYASVESLVTRAGVPRKALVPLAAAGALANVPVPGATGDGGARRRAAIWHAAGVARDPGGVLAGASWPEAAAPLPPLTPMEAIAMDYHFAQASPGRHPLALQRGALDRQGVLSAEAFKRAAGPPARATVAGLVITRQRPAARGFVFLTLEDETGHVDVAVSPKVFRRFQHVIRFAPALVVRGRVVAEANVRNVAGDWFAPLRLGDHPVPTPGSRDFH